MIIEVALGILLAIVILATAVLWIPLVVGVAALAAVAGLGYAIYLHPIEFAVPVLMLGALVLMAWIFQITTRWFHRKVWKL